jgi:hypothetical protein
MRKIRPNAPFADHQQDRVAMRFSASGRVSHQNSNPTDNPPPRGTRLSFLSLLQSPWAAPVFLLPFVLMLAVHQVFGLSDALLAADNPGERPAHGYNLLLGINMNLCLVAAVLHVFVSSQRVFPWIIAKLLIPSIILVLGLLAL